MICCCGGAGASGGANGARGAGGLALALLFAFAFVFVPSKTAVIVLVFCQYPGAFLKARSLRMKRTDTDRIAFGASAGRLAHLRILPRCGSCFPWKKAGPLLKMPGRTMGGW